MKNRNLIFSILTNVCLLLSGLSPLFSQIYPKDSIKSYRLQEVEVNGRRNKEIRSVLPIQTVTQSEILKLNASNVADVANTFSGVTLKDYGGIGGLKTISVRGMDANYTSVSYDGVMISNIQSGYIDLGRFPLDNIADISLSNAQPTDFLLPARVFSNGNLLNISTLLPKENSGKILYGKAYLKVGSFGLINPGFIILKNISEKSGFTLSSDFTNANGRYSFIQNYGFSSNDSSSVLKRNNSDVMASRSEFNFVHRPNNLTQLLFKTNFYYSDRGLPGSVTYYNDEKSQERLTDKSLFTQFQYKNRMNRKFQYNITARHQYSYTHYIDKNLKYNETNNMLSDEYTQNEYYTSFAVAHNLRDNFIISSAVDLWFNELDKKSNLEYSQFIYPKRITSMGNVAFKYITEKWNLGANILLTKTFESSESENTAPNKQKLSPTINFSYKLLEDKEYRIRFFYKNLYRLPTFNELYYQELGNKNLNPENANMFNIGVTAFESELIENLNIAITTDAYINNIKDKIVMIPKNGFYWTMINKGKVRIIGLDVNSKFDYKANEENIFSLKINYSLQNAKDKTLESANFDEQIPYMPLHSGNGSLIYSNKLFETGYNITYSGVRWIGQMTDLRNRLSPYIIHSLYAQTIYKRLNIKAEVINLFNTQYEIVKFYPMPRRNYRLSIIYNFN